MAAQKDVRIPKEAQRRINQLLAHWHLPQEFMTEIKAHRMPMTFSRRDTIFHQGADANVAYCVLSGLVKVYFALANGSQVIVRIAGPGDFVGILDGIGASGRRVQVFGVRAMTKVSLAIFTRDHARRLLKTMPSESLVASWKVSTPRGPCSLPRAPGPGLSFGDRLQWVFNHLASRYGARESQGILLRPELSHDDLAEMIASSRPMVTRLIAEFMEEGQVARRGKRYILLSTTGTNGFRPSSYDCPAN